jgi:hypothetical protein
MVALRSFALLGTASAITHKPVAHSIDHIEVGLIHTFKSDCGKKRHVSWVQHQTTIKKVKTPGAGMHPDDIEPYATVLKDGYSLTDCVKDKMYVHGDKHGNGKFEYNMEDIANVSIVHYTEIVAKEDQEAMTHQVCFEFCRTVPDMGFFGLNNGRDCYCTPYYKPMAGNSDECDAVCPGDPTLMCGGKTKSNVFSMHMCANTAEDLDTALGNAGDLISSLDGLTGDMLEVVSAGEKEANFFQDAFGKVGDPDASGLMQDAKVWAGELTHAADDGVAQSDALKEVEKNGKASKDKGDFSDYDNAKEAEEHIGEMQKLTAKGEETHEELTEMFEVAHPSAEVVEGAADQYYNIMYFVDKEFDEVPSTCGGETLAKPIFGKGEDECAMACDALVGKCVGFSFFEKDTSVCFLFGRFKSAQYYTGCGGEEDFLQVKKKKEAPYHAACKAKLSLFEGTTLKPDKSGKCDMCLKEATKAERCFE